MPTVLAVVNCFLAGLLAFYAIKYVRLGNAVARWLRVAYALIGIYWCVLYAWVAVTPVGVVDPVWFGQFWVRPAFTVTLAIMASGAIYRWRSHG